MWVGAFIFLSFMWGMGLGDNVARFEENKIKVVKKVGDN